MAQKLWVPAKLTEVAEHLKSGQSPEEVSVRTFLGWFRFQRRGYAKVQQIRRTLKQLGIRTEPDFDAVYIDAPIGFRLDTGKSAGAAGVPADPPLAAANDGDGQLLVGVAVADPTYRIGKLESANLALVEKELVRVPPTATLQEAVTLMLANDFSQLPVMQGDRTPKGVVSWAAIGARLALERHGTKVQDYMEAAQIVDTDTYLFAAVPSIVQFGYVLVQQRDGRVTGIVTTADLSLQFQQLGEPFLVLGEIENHIRRLIESAKFKAGELKSISTDGDDDRKIESVADLTFGDYVRLLQNQQNWDRLKLNIDRKLFISDMDRVREIRNDVMHFDPDGLGEADRLFLQKFVKFLQRLTQVGAF